MAKVKTTGAHDSSGVQELLRDWNESHKIELASSMRVQSVNKTNLDRMSLIQRFTKKNKE